MPQLLVRNVPEATYVALKRRAIKNGRSVEAEHRALLSEALQANPSEWFETAERMRAATRGRSSVPSWVLIREDRDAR